MGDTPAAWRPRQYLLAVSGRNAALIDLRDVMT